MNERIIELAEQSGLEYNFDPMLWLKYEKFAELIVWECLSYVKDGDIDFMKFMIKKHFGVKE